MQTFNNRNALYIHTYQQILANHTAYSKNWNLVYTPVSEQVHNHKIINEEARACLCMNTLFTIVYYLPFCKSSSFSFHAYIHACVQVFLFPLFPSMHTYMHVYKCSCFLHWRILPVYHLGSKGTNQSSWKKHFQSNLQVKSNQSERWDNETTDPESESIQHIRKTQAVASRYSGRQSKG